MEAPSRPRAEVARAHQLHEQWMRLGGRVQRGHHHLVDREREIEAHEVRLLERA